MGRAAELREQAMSLTRSMSTDDLVKAFALSDEQMTALEKKVDSNEPVDEDAYVHLIHGRRPRRARRAAPGAGMTAQPKIGMVERAAGIKGRFIVYYLRNGKSYWDAMFATAEQAESDFLAIEVRA